MAKLRRLIHSTLLALYLALVVLTIPLAFDVGGDSCGLLFSLFLVVAYALLTTLRRLARRWRFLKAVSILYYTQHVFIPTILMYFVLYYSHKAPESDSWPVVVWRYVLVHATPVFTVAEGFCSLLLIQAASQTLTYLQENVSDSWLLVSLMGLGATITGALYFLYRIYIHPFTLDLGNASLLGLFLTLCMGLGLYGIVSKKGSMIESSLLFAYIVRCIYETFPTLSEDASLALSSLFVQTTQNLHKELVRVPWPVPEHIHSALPVFAALIPHAFTTIWRFFLSAARTLTLPLVINLVYRIGVFYAATKIIPALYDGLPYLPPRTPMRSRQVLLTAIPMLHNDVDRKFGRAVNQRMRQPTVINLIYAYSPCLIIAVYTHLMMLYRGQLGTELTLWGWWDSSPQLVVHPWQFWNWVNMATTLFLYMAELANPTP